MTRAISGDQRPSSSTVEATKAAHARAASEAVVISSLSPFMASAVE
ncbi:hypothetical protein [Methylobacterium tardum]|nr:hypothetical protein [Methylobacterium tardum]